MCSCNETDQVSSDEDQSLPDHEEQLSESQSNTGSASLYPEKTAKDLLSRKFIAFIITLGVSLAVFLLVYLQTKDLKTFSDFLHNIFLLLAVYIGGNSIEKLTRLKK